MAGKVAILNGPSLNLLGTREPAIYGLTTLNEIEELCRQRAADRDLEVAFFRQTNHEGHLIDWVHEARTLNAAVVINPGAWMGTSMAIADSLKIIERPVVEVHISNVHRREGLPHSLVSKVATAVIAGLGHRGYLHAVDAVADLLSARPPS